MGRPNLNDIEKNPGVDDLPCEDPTGAVPGSSFEHGDSMYAKLQRLAGKLKVEQRGIERVPEDERYDNSYLNIGSMVCLNSASFRSTFPLTMSITQVVGRKYGRPVLHDRCFGKGAVQYRFRRWNPHHHLLQLALHIYRLLFLNLWSRVRPSPDGPLEVLVWMVGSQTWY